MVPLLRKYRIKFSIILGMPRIFRVASSEHHTQTQIAGTPAHPPSTDLDSWQVLSDSTIQYSVIDNSSYGYIAEAWIDAVSEPCCGVYPPIMGG